MYGDEIRQLWKQNEEKDKYERKVMSMRNVDGENLVPSWSWALSPFKVDYLPRLNWPNYTKLLYKANP